MQSAFAHPALLGKPAVAPDAREQRVCGFILAFRTWRSPNWTETTFAAVSQTW